MVDINPSIESVRGKEADLRAAFKKKFADKISGGVAYDQRDLDRLEQEDGYARCFLRTLLSKGDVDKAVDVVDTAFTFRKEINIWDITEDSFPPEVLEKKAAYYKGETKDGHPILYMLSGESRSKTPEERAIVKKYMAYMFEQHHRRNPEQMVVVMLDCHTAGINNRNQEVTKFMMTCYSTYFPAFLGYLIVYELPWILTAFWKLISAFISAESSGKVKMANKGNIRELLAEDQLWPHMK